MSTAQRLSDETWARLDQRAGRLIGKDRGRLAVGLSIVFALSLVGGGVWWSALFFPRVGFEASSGGRANPEARTFETVLTLHNSGPGTETVLSAGRSGPGLELLGVTGLPADVSPSGSVELTLSYKVTDCSAVPTTDWPVPVRLKRAWGARTAYPRVTLGLGPYVEDSAASSGSDDPFFWPWQRSWAYAACHPGEPWTDPAPEPTG